MVASWVINFGLCGLADFSDALNVPARYLKQQGKQTATQEIMTRLGGDSLGHESYEYPGRWASMGYILKDKLPFLLVGAWSPLRLVGGFLKSTRSRIQWFEDFSKTLSASKVWITVPTCSKSWHNVRNFHKSSGIKESWANLADTRQVTFYSNPTFQSKFSFSAPGPV